MEVLRIQQPDKHKRIQEAYRIFPTPRTLSGSEVQHRPRPRPRPRPRRDQRDVHDITTAISALLISQDVHSSSDVQANPYSRSHGDQSGTCEATAVPLVRPVEGLGEDRQGAGTA